MPRNKKLKSTQNIHSNDVSATGATSLREYEAVKHCKHCQRKFVIDQLKPGREPDYCRPACRTNAFRKKNGTTLFIDVLEANNPEKKSAKKPDKGICEEFWDEMFED